MIKLMIYLPVFPVLERKKKQRPPQLNIKFPLSPQNIICSSQNMHMTHKEASVLASLFLFPTLTATLIPSLSKSIML